ncbi:hypothetical protein AZH43_14365 [Acinetobacter pragensis]|uniref:Uncharacterized protein n=1 Tax=Acinetobacter pragensis TaxID=1806892 RepID=A0A151Y0F9_9GAMM|nr:hypothetical protein AZH43_14365 [Acinetobacter pragensis]
MGTAESCYYRFIARSPDVIFVLVKVTKPFVIYKTGQIAIFSKIQHKLYISHADLPRTVVDDVYAYFTGGNRDNL